MKTENFLNEGAWLLDIETDSLRADFGVVFVIVMKRFGRNDWRTFSIDLSKPDMEKAERSLLNEFRNSDELNDALSTGVIHFYGSKFDIPFLNTRLTMHGLPRLPKLKQLDMWYTVRRVFSDTVSSRRMAYIQSMLHAGDKKAPMKSGVAAELWRAVKFKRSESALAKVITHCRQDIRVLEYQVKSLRNLLPEQVKRT
jgi:uncharacterized protein YprB with RNaseH-like and TPR domain